MPVRYASAAATWVDGFLAQLLVGLAPIIVLLGFVLRKQWLIWTGVTLFGLYLAVGVIYGLVMGVWIPIHTFRNWKQLPWAGRIVLGLASAFIILCLGGIVVAWIRSRMAQ